MILRSAISRSAAVLKAISALPSPWPVVRARSATRPASTGPGASWQGRPAIRGPAPLASTAPPRWWPWSAFAAATAHPRRRCPPPVARASIAPRPAKSSSARKVRPPEKRRSISGSERLSQCMPMPAMELPDGLTKETTRHPPSRKYLYPQDGDEVPRKSLRSFAWWLKTP